MPPQLSAEAEAGRLHHAVSRDDQDSGPAQHVWSAAIQTMSSMSPWSSSMHTSDTSRLMLRAHQRSYLNLKDQVQW